MTRLRADAVLIAGPTASGKSAAALALAEALGSAAIVNADSMQVYEELSILTARPSTAEMARVPHRLFGHVSVRTPYSVGRYAEDAARTLSGLMERRITPIFTGGTGLYFSALTEGLADIPPMPAGIRAQARELLTSIGHDAFHALLAARDPAIARSLRQSDTQRMLRAWEVFEATGRSLADWQRHAARPVLKGLRLERVVLERPREVLRERIRARFEAMVEAGALDEAAALDDLDPALPAAKSLGIRELNAARRGEIPLAEAIEACAVLTGQYAKRQETWFRNRMADWPRLPAGDLGNFVTEMLKRLI